jgi:hypothetical protein
MRKYCDDEKVDLEMLTNLQILSTPEYDVVHFAIVSCLSVCLYVYAYTAGMYALLSPKRFDGFYLYSVYKSLSIVARCPLNMNILA